MSKDIVPELLKRLESDLEKKQIGSAKLKEAAKKLAEGTATHYDTQDFGLEAGKILASSLKENITVGMLPDGRMYYNIADRVIPTAALKNHKLVVNYAVDVQSLLNKRAGLGIKGIPIPPNTDRIKGMVNIAANAESYEDVETLILDSVENYSQSIVDEFIRFNAEFHQKAGLRPVIMRSERGGCCDWCEKLVGIYDYKDVKDTGNPVFKRHRGCDCLVVYDPNNGAKGKNAKDKTDVYQKDLEKIHAHILAEKTDIERNQQLKRYNGLTGNIVRRPRILGAFEPGTLKATLEEEGYKVLPLGGGNYKDIPFEGGGGYRVIFDGDGYIQYHPQKRSHHKRAYYKISTGPTRKRWYYLDGEEIDEKSKTN